MKTLHLSDLSVSGLEEPLSAVIHGMELGDTLIEGIQHVLCVLLTLLEQRLVNL